MRAELSALRSQLPGLDEAKAMAQVPLRSTIQALEKQVESEVCMYVCMDGCSMYVCIYWTYACMYVCILLMVDRHGLAGWMDGWMDEWMGWTRVQGRIGQKNGFRDGPARVQTDT